MDRVAVPCDGELVRALVSWHAGVPSYVLKADLVPEARTELEKAVDIFDESNVEHGFAVGFAPAAVSPVGYPVAEACGA